MTLLTIVENATDDLGISKPTTVIGNTDLQIIQMLSLANRGARALARRWRWQNMLLENTFTQAAAADQGLLNSTVVSTGDFDYIIDDTMWNRATSLPVLGSLNPVDWQTLQAFPVTGPYQQYKIERNRLYFDPVGANATDTIAFHYKSTFWCESAGGAGQTAWTADADVGRLDEELLTLDLIWRWRKRKGLEYAEDMQIFEQSTLDAIARDGGNPRLALNGGIRHRLPGVMVPLGSWSV
jgi:hypothetical protein